MGKVLGFGGNSRGTGEEKKIETDPPRRSGKWEKTASKPRGNLLALPRAVVEKRAEEKGSTRWNHEEWHMSGEGSREERHSGSASRFGALNLRREKKERINCDS